MPSSSKSQQRFFGVVKSMQKGDMPKKGKAGKAAKSMSKDDVDDFASTKHKGLPNKVKREMRVKSLIKKMVREELQENMCLDLQTEKCWKGYEKKGMKKMFGKMYPNCVKKEEKINEAKETIFDVATRVMKDKQMYNYKSKKGMVKVDMQTANLLTKVFKKVNPKMKKILSDLGYNNPAGLMNTLWAVVK